MNLLFAVFFGAGAAAIFYNKMGRRFGVGNTKNLVITLGVVFVLTSIFFYTILVTAIPQN